jgi:flagellar hook-associated protein 1 FlgK
MPNIFTIGQSALSAAQAGMTTAGQNIANASTVGYSRQTVVQTAATPQALGFGFIGQGTQVVDIQRNYNDYLGTQVLAASSASHQLDTQYTQASLIDNMLADPSAGLSPALQSVFGSLQEMSVSPSDVATRQLFLSNAESLVSRFHDVGERLDSIRQGLNLQITSSVQSINAASQQLATLNLAIDAAQGVAGGKASNELLDQRNQVLLDLSKQVKVTVSEQSGQYSVFIGNGQPLVVGAQAHALKVLPSPTDSTRLEVAYDSAGQKSIMSANNLAGGTLGGLLDFRSQVLEPTQNELGRIALAMASQFNSINAAGVTPSGSKGGDIFNLPPMYVASNSSNTGSATLSASLADASKLTTSDYRLQRLDSKYVLSRSSDNVILKSSADFKDIQSAAAEQGFALSTAGAMNNGDEFKISPTSQVASRISVALTQVNGIAAASAAQSPGDNSNILKMLDVQTAKLLDGGTQSLQSAYAKTVSRIGSKTHELQVTSTSAQQILSQSERAIQDVSGVNLDEEAANLLRYQQAYQAAGKVMQIAKQMFDSLLQMN